MSEECEGEAEVRGGSHTTTVPPTCACCVGLHPPRPPAFPSTNAGRPFPKTYTKELKQQMVQQGKIDETGCPEYYFF